jgi:microcystin-dependent protein
MTGQLKLPDGSISAPALSFSNELTTGFNRPTSGEIGVVIGGSQIGYFNSAGFQGPGATPIGAVMPFAYQTPPSLWYQCYGQAVSRTTYSLLFSVLGTYWGIGDGSTTFNLPDFRGFALVGADNMGGSAAGRLPGYSFGSDGGAASVALNTTNVPAHTHNVSGTTGNDTPDHTHGYASPSSGAGTGSTPNYFDSSQTAATTSGASTRHTHSFNATTDNGTGSGSAFSVIQPTLALIMIIYAGA